MASLFTDRAIIYRIEQGFEHFTVALSVGVQKMIRSDLASAGVIFTLDTETGFKDVVMINSSWGLGEAVVKGEVIPDEFLVYKPTLEEGYKSIIKKQLGDKKIKIVYSDKGPNTPPVRPELVEGSESVKTVPTTKEERNSFSLKDEEILELSRYSVLIENHYSEIKGSWSPMDIEWAKDGIDGQLYILQARPETIHAIEQKKDYLQIYTLKDETVLSKVIVTGQSIGGKIAIGKAKVIASVENIAEIEDGDILVTGMTDPDWVPAMKKVAGIITNRGGRTCHAAIVSRELGLPAIVGANQATEKIKTGQEVTLDCSRGKTGYVYEGFLDFERIDIPLEKLSTKVLKQEIMINIADPDRAFVVSLLPNDGVGLARIEFIISNFIQIHPMALIDPGKVTDKMTIEKIEYITRAYKDKKSFFVDTLAYGIGTIAAAFYPKPVIVRFSDFKSNEYRNLIGGKYFEPVEENPMLGFRGASRYYNDRYKSAFALECDAIKKVRNHMGLKNVKVMVPLVRTIEEAKKVIKEIEKNGLKRGQDELEFVMMCETPANSLLIDGFCQFFDGFSIGSNDLTQFTLGVDRDSAIVAYLFDERNPAVKKMMDMVIEGALNNSRYIGICGQAPSDLPEIVKFLIECGITSISLNPDAVVPFLMRY